MDPDPRFLEGVELFNSGNFYKAHDPWESRRRPEELPPAHERHDAPRPQRGESAAARRENRPPDQTEALIRP
ncbi:MAG: DUF309 domain-containing protein [Planctomycetes bacterium]|nr:DUF309 domain-containing protein [Planctomycetota bacterium]